jgi:hypothetical protein
VVKSLLSVSSHAVGWAVCRAVRTAPGRAPTHWWNMTAAIRAKVLSRKLCFA